MSPRAHAFDAGAQTAPEKSLKPGTGIHIALQGLYLIFTADVFPHKPPPFPIKIGCCDPNTTVETNMANVSYLTMPRWPVNRPIKATFFILVWHV